jgi:23S rRNA pseudouridine2605 synthase
LTEPIRLQKALSAAGVSSRRKAEEMMLQGRIKVNGKVVRELGTRVSPETDSVMVDGRPIQLDPDRIYLAFHKPKGVVSTMSDEFGRSSLADFFQEYDRVFNVGRLDQETTGLLIMTNDGDLANKLAHPRHEVSKLYAARVKGRLEKTDIQILKEGVKLEDGVQKADSVKIVDQRPGETLVEIELHSGKNRIVRRMFEAIGHPVVDLTRRSFGPLRLGALKPGQYRELSKLEVSSLLAAAETSK